MKATSLSLLKPVLLSATLCLIPLANSQAHESGDWLLKVGVTNVSPKSNNGSLANGTVDLDVKSSTRPSFSITYMATKNIGVELLGALPFKHSLNSNLGNIGETKQLPPTLSLQYHFLPDNTIQPYVGVGLNYTHFFSTKAGGALAGNDLKIKNSWGLAAQVGVDVSLNKNWFLNADVRYINIRPDVQLNGQSIGKAKINPWVTTVGVGYRF
ncbi:OmpW/AlkL family protein [Alcaligenes endophyticus]|uniref:OmpW family protein n=1 Tax=Alcaligenes endophyticus TaxID=1929088 RepID=A0ABT8EHN6_9BURK|nr:OmpW family protein [Alcaligenes endophyticus]MCX5592147.1 OmpW family protein [Alcaligenes endophyticus]MDN4120794.1 OmpW family protein [Alcaligenes endophyticus]